MAAVSDKVLCWRGFLIRAVLLWHDFLLAQNLYVHLAAPSSRKLVYVYVITFCPLGSFACPKEHVTFFVLIQRK
jgi:hypothetical protein